MRDARQMCVLEHQARSRGYRFIAGIDEAGRGPLAGPVVASAVVLPPDYENRDIDDSKKLTPRQRDRLYEVIQEDAVSVAIGVCEAPVVDQINILQATLAAMREAVMGLGERPDYLLVDGINKISVSIPQETVIHGDARSISVAAASIIAKVSRDRIMEMYHRQFPQYNFLKNKGYGTPEHQKAIIRYGRCKIHRFSFHVAKIDCLRTNGELEL